VAGNLVHFELAAKDTARAKQFWSSLLGWRFQEPWGGMEYHMMEGLQPGGAIMEGEPGNAVIYFDTDDIDASIGRVRELGGKADDKQPIPTIGWFARCQDSEGNSFSLFHSDESVPMPG
jgi:predicted enzyme related to lactoylglutathione lyase